MSETEPNDPGPVPSEKTRRLNIALNADTEEVLRAVSGRTSISIADLRRAIEESPVVALAAKQVLRYRYDAWVKELEGAEDIFGRAKEE
jgi:hypothetical protein